MQQQQPMCWSVKINKEKSSNTLFTLSTKQNAGTITPEGKALKKDDEATYLGVTFDKRLTWKPHIARVEKRARQRLAIIQKLAGTKWGSK